MKKLFWSHDPVMSSVYASEGWVQHLRDTVGSALERAVAPAAEYLETLEPFVEFLNVDGEHLFPLFGVSYQMNYMGHSRDKAKHLKTKLNRTNLQYFASLHSSLVFP